MNEDQPGSRWKTQHSRLTTERAAKLLRVAQARTDRIRLVLQDVTNPHNISACLRSAEAFGLSQVEVVTGPSHRTAPKFTPSTVARGVSKWLEIRPHDSISSAVQALRQDKFYIAVALPHSSKGPLYNLQTLPVADVEQTYEGLALVFGNERLGVDPEWDQDADAAFNIPMVGIVESLNISVAAAVSIHVLAERARQEWPRGSYLLDTAKRLSLLDRWVGQHLQEVPC